jgi:LuxR family maltose regulon positive regulatory protein
VDKQIGRRLGITEHAVRYHLKNIYRKLGVHDRVGALSRARDVGTFG